MLAVLKTHSPIGLMKPQKLRLNGRISPDFPHAAVLLYARERPLELCTSMGASQTSVIPFRTYTHAPEVQDNYGLEREAVMRLQ